MEAIMKYRIEDINIGRNGKEKVPDLINFVWVGNLNVANLEYMKIWKETNTDKEIYLWVDDSTYIFNFFHEEIGNYVSSQQSTKKQELEIEIKNQAYEYITKHLDNHCDIDKLALSFLLDKKITKALPEILNYNSPPALEGVTLKNINELFADDFNELKRYYLYEIILRGNFASASDIVRLIIIFQYGGVYLDMDTLPNTDCVFEKLNCFLNEKDMLESDFILSLKTKLILAKLNLINIDNSKEQERFESIFYSAGVEFERLITLANEDLNDFTISKIPSLGSMYVHKNLLSLGSLKKLKGVYFNSFLASHAKSKGLSIIIRTLKKRYKFIEKNSCIFSAYQGNVENCYLTRMLTWRTELYTRNYVVTSALSGPGLLVECLLGLAYHLLDLSPSFPPSSVAVEMQDEKYGIALFQHNLHTPDGNDSSWRD